MKNELLMAAHDGFVGGIRLYIALAAVMILGPIRAVRRIGSAFVKDEPMQIAPDRVIKPH